MRKYFRAQPCRRHSIEADALLLHASIRPSRGRRRPRHDADASRMPRARSDMSEARRSAMVPSPRREGAVAARAGGGA